MDFFSLLAECSITLAGFSAIYAILQGSTGPRGSFRSIGTLGSAALAFFISVLPPLFSLLAISDALLWSICSAIASIFAASFFVTVVKMNGTLTANGFPPQTSKSLALAFLLVAISAILFAIDVFPWPNAVRIFIYGFGVLLLMCVPVSAMAVSFVVALEEAIKNSSP
jgi:hypothetical protein